MNVQFLEDELNNFVQKHLFLSDFVLPDYEKFNVKNIRSIIGKAFSLDTLGLFEFPDEYLDDFRGIEKILLVIVDGLGYSRLLNYIKNSKGIFSDLVEKGVSKFLTSTFPATTSTSLTSIFTGLMPSQHKIIGYQMYSKEYGLVFNTLNMRPVYAYGQHIDFAQEFSDKIRPWMPLLKKEGIDAMIATKGSLVESGLSHVIHRHQEVLPYIQVSDMLTRCRKILEQTKPVLLTVYYSGYDTSSHAYGPYSEESTAEIQSWEYSFKNFLLDRLSSEAKKKTLVLITADHGFSETSKTVFLKDFPTVLHHLLLPPVGDSRAAFLFSKQGQTESLKTSFEKNIAGFNLVLSEELIEKGAFGKTENSENLEAIVGDLTALSKSQNALAYPYFDDDRYSELRGAHGGMSANEVIVPLLSSRLSKL